MSSFALSLARLILELMLSALDSDKSTISPARNAQPVEPFASVKTQVSLFLIISRFSPPIPFPRSARKALITSNQKPVMTLFVLVLTGFVSSRFHSPKRSYYSQLSFTNAKITLFSLRVEMSKRQRVLTRVQTRASSFSSRLKQKSRKAKKSFKFR